LLETRDRPPCGPLDRPAAQTAIGVAHRTHLPRIVGEVGRQMKRATGPQQRNQSRDDF